MKVMWFTNILLPDAANAIGLTSTPFGGWMPSLSRALLDSPKVELGVATCLHGVSPRKISNGKCTYYLLPQRTKQVSGTGISSKLLSSCVDAVNDYSPDIVHVHGTESFYGLLIARGLIKQPSVISLQGLISAYKRHYFGGLTLTEAIRFRTLRDWLSLNGIIEQWWRWGPDVARELEIINGSKHFIGRTSWDRAHLCTINPMASYHICDELMRPTFYQRSWNIADSDPFTIYTSSAYYPLKGFHWLLRAVAILKREFPQIKLRVGGSRFSIPGSQTSINQRLRLGGYDNFIQHLISCHRLQDNVVPLGFIGEDEVADELQRARVFVLPSLIENSPNSLVEAMLVGTPTIATCVGGIPDLVNHDGVILSPPADEVALSERIRELFLNESLAQSLSISSRNHAHQRPSANAIAAQMQNIYKSVIDSYRNTQQ